jgi:hypothetical protein
MPADTYPPRSMRGVLGIFVTIVHDCTNFEIFLRMAAAIPYNAALVLS